MIVNKIRARENPKSKLVLLKAQYNAAIRDQDRLAANVGRLDPTQEESKRFSELSDEVDDLIFAIRREGYEVTREEIGKGFKL